MSSTTLAAERTRWRIPQSYVPVLATLALLLVLYAIGASQYTAFSNIQVVLNVFIDNGFLLVVAVGMTFVILTGGIDLSVGSVVAMTAMVCASLLRADLPAPLVLFIALAIGPTLGFGMGCIIHFFEIQPFIATLIGMFFARGLCYTITTEAYSIDNATIATLAQTQIPLGGELHISISVVVALVVVAAAAYVLGFTRFGRTVYSIGGNAQSAMLMGLKTGRTKIAVYTISGVCSALGGLLLVLYKSSGDPLNGVGLELTAIAAVVIGGTILTGGSGYVLGTVLGIMVLGIIQTLITFDGTLNSWWTSIITGALLFVFIVLQRLVTRRTR